MSTPGDTQIPRPHVPFAHHSLGLAISRSIVGDKHGGSLTFHTKVGEGTTFVVTLPLRVTGATADVQR